MAVAKNGEKEQLAIWISLFAITLMKEQLYN